MRGFHVASALFITTWVQGSFGATQNFGEQTFTILDTQPTTRYGWDTGDLLIADFGVKGSIGSISGGKNKVVIPEVKVFGNTIVPEVRRDTRSGLRFTADLQGYAGAVLSAGMTLGGGQINGAIGLGPSLKYPDQVRAGRYFSLQGDTLVNHTTSSLNLGLPSLDAGMDVLIGGSGSGRIEYGLFPITGYQIGDFDFNLPDISLPVWNLNLDLNLPSLPDFGFLDIPDLIPDSDKDTALFRKKLPPGNPLLSAGEVVLDNPAATATTVTAVDGKALVQTTTGDIGRIGLDIDGIISYASTGVSFTGLEASVGKLATVKYDTVDVKYGLELGYEIENRLDSYLEVNLNFLDPTSGDPVSVLLRDAGNALAASSYAGRWDALPEIALLSDQDVDLEIDFTGLKRELSQKGSLTLSDYMELKVLAASAKITLGPGINLGPLLYKKFDLAGELAAFEIYDEMITLTDLGLTDGLWDDTITINAIENVDVHLKSDASPLDDAGSYQRVDDHTAITSLTDKTLVIGTADPGATTLAEVTPITYSDPGATRSVVVEAWDVYNSSSVEVNATQVQDAGQILSIGGLHVPEGSTYINQGIRRFDLFSVENDGVIANQGWLDFQAPGGQMLISGKGTLFFGAQDDSATNASGSISADGLIHGKDHTIDFGPTGRYNGNLQARANLAVPDGYYFPYGFYPLDDTPIDEVMPNRQLHTVDITGTFQNQGTILSRAPTRISAGTLINDATGVIEGTDLAIRANDKLRNLGLIAGSMSVHTNSIEGSRNGNAPGLFRAGSSNGVADNMTFWHAIAGGSISLSGDLDFTAEQGGILGFDKPIEIAAASAINLITDPNGTIRLNGLRRLSESGKVSIDNLGLLDIVSGRSSLQSYDPLCTGTDCLVSTIEPIDLNNEGTLRIHAGAEFAFGVAIVDYAEGGATLAGGNWELLGADTRFANNGAVSNPSQTAIMDVRVNKVFGNGALFDDLTFDQVTDQTTGDVEITGINGLDTELVFNNASVTLSGAAKFDYFNTLRVNRGSLNLLNQHQFNTVDSYENRGGTTWIDSGAGLHVNGALLVNGGQVSFTGAAELSVNGFTETLDDGTTVRHDIEVNGGALTIADGTQVSSGLISRGRPDGLLLQGGRSWVVRDSVTTNPDGTETTTPGLIDLGMRSTNGTYGVVRNNADVLISGEAATFKGFESTLLYQHGRLTIADGKVYESPNSYFRNANEMTLNGGQFLMSNGEFRNDGELNVGIDSYLGVDFLNLLTGVVNVEGVVDSATAYVASDVNLIDGLFNSGSIEMAGAGAFLVEGGTLLTNSLAGSLLIESGVFAPGQSIGTTDVLGDYTQGADGVLEIEWGSAGGDLLNIQDQGNLAGSVQLALLDGFVPAAGDSLEILTAASIFGSFDPDVALSESLAGLGFAVRQELNSVYLDVFAAPVPLPPSAWLFGSALVGLFIPRRRRL